MKSISQTYVVLLLGVVGLVLLVTRNARKENMGVKALTRPSYITIGNLENTLKKLNKKDIVRINVQPRRIKVADDKTITNKNLNKNLWNSRYRPVAIVSILRDNNGDKVKQKYFVNPPRSNVDRKGQSPSMTEKDEVRRLSLKDYFDLGDLNRFAKKVLEIVKGNINKIPVYYRDNDTKEQRWKLQN